MTEMQYQNNKNLFDRISRTLVSTILLFFTLSFVMAPDAKAQSRLVKIIFDMYHAGPNSLADMPPLERIEAPLRTALVALAMGDLRTAKEKGEEAGFRHVVIEEDGGKYSILQSIDQPDVHATIVVDHAPLRDLIIEAAHPKKDLDTDRQAAVLFKMLGARVLILAGANRCAARAETACSGRTRICNRDFRDPYRTSDVAHSVDNVFHIAHTVFASFWPNAIFLQPHGFSNKGSSVWFVFSDTSTRSAVGDSSVVGRLRNHIRDSLARRDRAISCQDSADNEIETRRLCASTNVQGRMLNGSRDACLEKTKKSSGRFVHVEQVYYEVRRPFGYNWSDLKKHPGSIAILNALAAETPCLKASGCGLRSLGAN